MLEVIIFVVVLVVLIPVGFLMSTSVAAGVLGWLLKSNAESENEGSELLDVNF